MKCSHLNLPPFYYLPPNQTFFVICPFARANRKKTTTSKSMQIHKRKRHLKPFNDHASHYNGSQFFGHKSPAARARELFKPSTDSASLPVKIEKKNFSFSVWRSLGGPPQVGVFLLFFSHLWPALGPNPLGHSFGSRFFWKLVQNPRL